MTVDTELGQTALQQVMAGGHFEISGQEKGPGARERQECCLERRVSEEEEQREEQQGCV